MENRSSLVKVESVPTEWEARILVGLLEDEGIRATTTGGFTAGFRAEAPGYVSVLVDETDKFAACQITEEYFRQKKVQNEQRAGEPSVIADGRALRSTGSSIVGILVLTTLLAGFAMGSFSAAACVAGLATLIIGSAVWFRHRLDGLSGEIK